MRGPITAYSRVIWQREGEEMKSIQDKTDYANQIREIADEFLGYLSERCPENVVFYTERMILSILVDTFFSRDITDYAASFKVS